MRRNSGFSEADLHASGKSVSPSAFLSKPYRKEELIARIGKILAGQK